MYPSQISNSELTKERIFKLFMSRAQYVNCDPSYLKLSDIQDQSRELANNLRTFKKIICGLRGKQIPKDKAIMIIDIASKINKVILKDGLENNVTHLIDHHFNPLKIAIIESLTIYDRFIKLKNHINQIDSWLSEIQRVQGYFQEIQSYAISCQDETDVMLFIAKNLGNVKKEETFLAKMDLMILEIENLLYKRSGIRKYVIEDLNFLKNFGKIIKLRIAA